MNNGNNRHLCPACGKTQCPNGKLICRQCFEKWQIDSGRSIARYGEPILMPLWVLPRAKGVLAETEKKLQEVLASYRKLQKEVADSARKELSEKLGGRKVTHVEFATAFKVIRCELWRTKRGNSLHRERRVLEETGNCLRTIIKDLEKEKAEHEKAQAKSNAGSPRPPEEEREQQINEGYQRLAEENSPSQEIPEQENLQTVKVPASDKPTETDETNETN